MDLITFSLLTMTTAGPPADLEPIGEAAQLFTGLQAAVGITLTGLLGFVLGNRIRREGERSPFARPAPRGFGPSRDAPGLYLLTRRNWASI